MCVCVRVSFRVSVSEQNNLKSCGRIPDGILRVDDLQDRDEVQFSTGTDADHEPDPGYRLVIGSRKMFEVAFSVDKNFMAR